MSFQKQINYWMQEALELAKKAASEDEVPVGAVIIYQGQIISKGYNRREQVQDPLAHAEVMAIQNAANVLGSWRLVNCSLIVTLEPCFMCLAASQQARIQELIYGTSDPKGGALSLGYRMHEDRRMNHRFPAALVETPACSQILKDFFKQKRQ